MRKFIINIIRLSVLFFGVLFCFNILYLRKFAWETKNERPISLFNPNDVNDVLTHKVHQPDNIGVHIIGTSRTAGFEDEMFKSKMYNYCMMTKTIIDIFNLLKDLNVNNGDKLIIGIDQWTFNKNWTAYTGERGEAFQQINRYVKKRINLNFKPFNTLISKDYELVGTKAIKNFSGFKRDGSYFYGKRFITPNNKLKDYKFINTKKRIKYGTDRFQYGDIQSIDRNSIKVISKLFRYIQERDIDAIVFSPPFAPSINKIMGKHDYSYISESIKLLKHLSSSYGIKYYNFTNIDGFENDFFLDGFHCNRNVYFEMVKRFDVEHDPNFDNRFNLSKEESVIMAEYFD